MSFESFSGNKSNSGRFEAIIKPDIRRDKIPPEMPRQQDRQAELASKEREKNIEIEKIRQSLGIDDAKRQKEAQDFQNTVPKGSPEDYFKANQEGAAFNSKIEGVFDPGGVEKKKRDDFEEFWKNYKGN